MKRCYGISHPISLFCLLLLVPPTLMAQEVLPPGVVESHQKISSSFGGLDPTVLDDQDFFGSSVALLGDLDGDNIADIAVGAAEDADGGINRGAVYILFLNVNGTVKSHQKISDTEGNFTGDLDDNDLFGFSVAALGDLDGDNITDLAVGARSDDDGGGGRGAVYILFLDTDGTVKSHQKISDTEGNFTGPLDDLDLFGYSVAALGDHDGDNIEDLAVGAQQDDGDGTSRGAVYMLFLNTNGTVKSHQEISDGVGGFNGTLIDGDRLGTSTAALGDLDGDTITDLAVGAGEDDDGGLNRGAVWILLLNADGTVKSHQKISDLAGGFTGGMDNLDEFGASAAGLGDLDGDNIVDVAVGAIGDDDGGTSRGAIWILFLNTDGTVKFHQKISPLSGGLNPILLDDFDRFGSSLALLGDLDADGKRDIVTGAIGDADGGPARGAAYVLFLDGQQLPVELTHFEAYASGTDVSLAWTTATETDNAGFEVEMRPSAVQPGAWQTLDWVDGAGTTTEAQMYRYRVSDLAPGRYLFRLKQVDFDGAFAYSHAAEATVAVPGTHYFGPAFPNPFRAASRMGLTVSQSQTVDIAVFDALGRQVSTVFQGPLGAGRARTFTLEATRWPTGVYLVRVIGETFEASRQVMVVR